MTKRTWDTDAERERKAKQREKKRLEEKDAGMPWLGMVGEEREQAIRDFYGYSASETSTQAERQARADRITGSEEAQTTLAEARKIWAAQQARAEASRKSKRDLASIPDELRAILNGNPPEWP